MKEETVRKLEAKAGRDGGMDASIDEWGYGSPSAGQVSQFGRSSLHHWRRPSQTMKRT